jgi:hypothetical protein
MATKEKSMLVQAEHDDTAKKQTKKWLETEKGKGRVVQRFLGGGSTSASGVQHIPALSNMYVCAILDESFSVLFYY